MYLKIFTCIMLTPIMLTAGALIGLSIGFLAFLFISAVTYIILIPINIVFSLEVKFYLLPKIVIYIFIALGALAGAFKARDFYRRMFYRSH